MLHEVLQHLIDNDKTKVDQIAIIADVSKQTVRNWLSGEAGPKEVSIRRLLICHPSQEVKDAILSEMTRGRASFPSEESEPNLDLNKDGVVNLGDALSACVGAIASVQSTLSAVHKNFEHDPDSITVAVQDVLHAEVVVATRFLEIVDRICTREVSRRRKAKE